MNSKKNLQPPSSALSLTRTDDSKTTSSADPFSDRPRKPDWLILFMSALLLLTLLIIWLVDIPALLH